MPHRPVQKLEPAGAELVEARSSLVNREHALLRGQTLRAVDVERNERARDDGDPPAVVIRHKALRQNVFVDRAIDVPECDPGDDGGLGQLEHVQSGVHEMLP